MAGEEQPSMSMKKFVWACAMIVPQAVFGCGGSADNTTIKIPEPGTASMPEKFDWVISRVSNQQKIFTIKDMTKVYSGEREVDFNNECPDINAELDKLDQQILGAEFNGTLNFTAKYFAVNNAPFNYLTLAEQMGSIDTKIGAKVSPVNMKATAKGENVTLNLLVAYTTYVIDTNEAFDSCLKSSLKSSGQKGKTDVPDAIIVGAVAVLRVGAKRLSAGVGVGYQDIVGVDLEVNLSDIKIDYSQWGTSSGLDTAALLTPLHDNPPNPSQVLGVFKSKISKNGYIGIRRKELDL